MVDKLAAAGFGDIVVNIHHFADMIEEYFRNPGSPEIRISFSDERAQLLETGGGIRHAAELLKENNPEKRFLIHNVDILSNVDLKAFWAKGADADATLLVSERETQRYLIFDATDRLVGWTNIKTGEVKTPFPQVREAFDPTYTAPVNSGAVITSPFFRPLGSGPYNLYAFAGIHQMKTTLLPLMDRWPDKFSIIDFYLEICASHRIEAYIQPGLRLMDVGKLDTLSEADRFAQELG